MPDRSINLGFYVNLAFFYIDRSSDYVNITETPFTGPAPGSLTVKAGGKDPYSWYTIKSLVVYGWNQPHTGTPKRTR